MQLHSFERRNSYIFFAILNQTHELFFAPPGIHDTFRIKGYPFVLYVYFTDSEQMKNQALQNAQQAFNAHENWVGSQT